jgi:hypothetical protein
MASSGADEAKMSSAVAFLLGPAIMGCVYRFLYVFMQCGLRAHSVPMRRTPAAKLTPYLKSKLGLSDTQAKEALKRAAEAPKIRPDKVS